MGRVAGTANARLVGAIVTVALLCGACASASDSAEPADQPSETADGAAAVEPAGDDTSDVVPTAAPEQASDEPTIDELYVSPIGEALGVAQDEIAAGFETYVRNAEELVRSCMADAGFDYTPVTLGFDQQTRQAELEATLSPEQFTAEYGFGIATLFELNFKGEGVVDFVNQQFGPPPEVQRSSGEQAAYEMALNGQTTQGLTAAEAQEQLFGDPAVNPALPGSCRNYGYTTAENPRSAYDGLFSLLGDEFDALNDKFDNDPRIRDGWTQWQTCMAANGHSYEDRFEIFDELFTSANDLANQYLSSPQILTALGQAQQEGFVSMDSAARAAFLEEVGALQGFSWVPEVQANHDELVAFELRVAADSQDCLDEGLFAQVQFELETDFVQAHADQFALLAAGDS